MEAQHLANNEKTPTGLVADHNDLMKPALHLHRASATRGGWTRSLAIGVRPESYNSVDFRAVLLPSHVHLLGNLFGDDVDDGFAGCSDVFERVLVGRGPERTAVEKHTMGGLELQAVK